MPISFPISHFTITGLIPRFKGVLYISTKLSDSVAASRLNLLKSFHLVQVIPVVKKDKNFLSTDLLLKGEIRWSSLS